jgi:glycosidase
MRARLMAPRLIACLAAALLQSGAAWSSADTPTAGPLHVPSPDWREQVIYFVMTDRFDDGDPKNNDFGAGEYDPTRNSHYSGGDLRGLMRRLDYIRGLGATAVWLTPPVANQWSDPLTQYTGYHGYWAEHFKRVDKHLGTLADYRRLSRALHGRGMYLVQDIVLNHTGNFFDYAGGWDANDPARFYRGNPGSRPVTAPSQKPFDLNDPRRAADRRAGIYHWTPGVADYNDPAQEANFQMSGLDDLNTENPAVRRALRDSYGFWVREAGVDAFRVDTAFYVPPDFFHDFLRAKDRRAPGIYEVARATGRRDFHVFGEGFGIDKPYDDTQTRKIERYMTDASGRALMPGMLNFPLYGALGDVFARGRPTAELAHRIERTMALHARPHLMPTFVDNHDVDRFLAGGSVVALRQSLLAIFTLPGIPTVYYGTEQGLTEQRASMFAGGYGSGGRNRFDTDAPGYRLLAALSALRRSDKVFTQGAPTVLARSSAGPGALAWRMAMPGRAPAIVVVNTADHEVLLDKLDPGLPAGTRLQARFALDGPTVDARVGADGRVTMVLPARAGWVWTAGGVDPAAAPPAAGPTLDALPAAVMTGDFQVGGSARAPFRLVVDGDLARAQTIVPDAQGRWRTDIDTSRMVDPEIAHEVVAWDAQTGAVSSTRRFKVERAWALVADVADPAGDDIGIAPGRSYLYPTDPTFRAVRSMDLRRVKVSGAGGALRLDLTMAGLASSWNPPNGFDHVALTIFIELPGQPGGSTVMPLQNGSLPGGMRWHRRLRVGGWSSALFTAEGASATNEGTSTTPGARITLDRASQTIGLVLPSASLGGATSLRGVKLYVTTWDYDGGYRALAAQPAGHVIGGGDPAAGPRVMDDSAVIVLP